MAITAAVCTSFKSEVLQGVHLAADVYKIALFPSTATLSAATTAYSSAGECANGNGYATGGINLVGYSVTVSGTTAVLDWTTDPAWPASTIAAAGALIYNSTRANKACVVLSFGGTITSTNDVFTVALPVADATTGLIKLA